MLRVPLIATAVIVVVLAGGWATSLVSAQRKLEPLGPTAPRGDYRVTLDFAPERFHQLRLQEAGRLVEVRGNTVFLRDVTPPALRAIAGEYWVGTVERWDGK
jgi:hypothetical protein